MIMGSIKFRLILLLLLTVILTSIVSIITGNMEAEHEINEIFDAQLAQEARIIQNSFLSNLTFDDPTLIQSLLDSNTVIIPQAHGETDDVQSQYGHSYERKVAFQIWHRDKGLLMRSLSAPSQALSEQGLVPAMRGFEDVKYNNETWRVFSLWDNEEKILVQTAENQEIRSEMVHEISEQLLSTSLFFLPVLVIVVVFAVYTGLSPLRLLETQIRQRHPENLEKIDISHVPKEISGMGTALNNLLGRIKQTLDKERQFTDDAAHELRTPLAALKTQTQVALRSTSNTDRENALNQILLGVDRTAHLVQQLLNLSRIGNERISMETGQHGLHQAITSVLALQAHNLGEKNIEVRLDDSEEIMIEADPGILGMLLVNIIDNAIKYSPDNSALEISIARQKQHSCVTIRDHGPGIAEELQHRVFDRFYRISGNQAPGCGLGLSIAQRCAQLLHATIEMSTPDTGTGLQVSICFGDNRT